MFEERHKKGSESNSDLHKAMNTHIKQSEIVEQPLRGSLEVATFIG